MNLMKKFIQDRGKLKAYSKILYYDSDSGPYLFIEDPRLLAGFAGYLKFQCLNQKICSKVFYRGQNRDYSIIPSLFRDINGIRTDNERIKLRKIAYSELVQTIPDLYKAYRFKDENINPILQHYGIRTPWIDLVDNVYIAIWFALRKPITNQNGLVKFVRSDEKFGWIYFLSMADELEFYDLREKHSSLSLRLHVQHGISATKKTNHWDMKSRDLKDFIIARIKIPNVPIWSLDDLIFRTEYLFPNENIDNTYKYLKMKKFKNLLKKILEKYNLESVEIGNITNYIQ